MNHTEGPWWVEPADDGGDGCEVWDGYGHTATVWGEPEVAMANAKLIAAAPDLLAVCSAIAHDLSLFQFTDGEYRLSEQSAGVILHSLREAIAKAEGRGE
jgi:hypothetical protein